MYACASVRACQRERNNAFYLFITSLIVCPLFTYLSVVHWFVLFYGNCIEFYLKKDECLQRAAWNVVAVRLLTYPPNTTCGVGVLQCKNKRTLLTKLKWIKNLFRNRNFINHTMDENDGWLTDQKYLEIIIQEFSLHHS